MSIYLNYYANIKHSIGANVSVSNTIPKWNLQDIDMHLKYIAPKWEIVNMYKDEVISYREFIDAYKTQLIVEGSLNKLIRDIGGYENCTLLCYEVKGCHRELLGQALKEMGFDVYNIEKGGNIKEINGGLI